MKKTQINALEKMLADENVKGKNFIEKVIWLNTAKPKFKIGDCFVVTDRGHRIYGYPLNDVKSTITEIRYDTSLFEIIYMLEAQIDCEKSIITVELIPKTEADLKSCKKCKDNINVWQIK